MEKVIFSYPDIKQDLRISKNVVKIIEENKAITMENNVFNRGEFSIHKKDLDEGDIIELFVDDNVDLLEYTGQMVAPLTIGDKLLGSIIFYRDKKINYPGKTFVKTKLKSIILAKDFLEELLKKEVVDNNCFKLVNN